MNKLYIISFLAIMLFSNVALAQEYNTELDNNVKVLKDYDPMVADAFKINHLPKIIDTVKVSPYFNYSIAKRPIGTQFKMNPLKAATMVGEPINRLFRGYVRAGFGNYLSPMAEISIADLRSEKHAYGLYVGNYSSFGKIDLMNNTEVDNKFTTSEVNLFGKYFFKNSFLKSEAYFTNNFHTIYGFDYGVDTTGLSFGGKKIYNLLGAKLQYKSTYVDSSHLNYDINLNYQYFKDALNFNEQKAHIHAGLNKYWGREIVGAKIQTTYFNRNNVTDTSTNMLIAVNPFLRSYGKKWHVNLGVEFSLDGIDGSFNRYLYPRINMQYDIAKQYFIPFIEIDGFLEVNNYSKIAKENPFILSGQAYNNTNHKLIFGGGIKGNFSRNFYYHFSFNYSLIDNMYFYVNDFDNAPKDQFELVYDNVRLAKAYGQISFMPTEELNFELNGYYNKFYLTNLIQPWHKPEYVVNFISNYTLKKKIRLELTTYVQGKRYVLPDASAAPMQLGEIIDINLGIEYKFTKLFSAFAQFNNIAHQKYELYYLYPMQQFNFMMGITYSL